MPLNMQSGYRRKHHELPSVITWSLQESSWISVTLFFNLLLREAGIRYRLIKTKGKKGRTGQVEGKFHPLYLTSSSRLCTVCRAEIFKYFVVQFKQPFMQSSMSDLQPKPSKTEQCDTNLYLQVTRLLCVTCDCDLQCIKSGSKSYSTFKEKEFAAGGRREKSETTVYMNTLSWSEWA